MQTVSKRVLIGVLGVVLVLLVVVLARFVPFYDETAPRNFICNAPRYKLLTTHMPASVVERVLGVQPSYIRLHEEDQGANTINDKPIYEEASYLLDGWDGSILVYYNTNRNVVYKTCGHG